MRKLLAFLAGLAVLLAAELVTAQVPPPVPALPDSSRLTQYTISSSVCNCPVNFALYGDGTDVDNWIQVFIGTTEYLSTDPSFGWSITSPSGPLSSLARPITDAVLNFNSTQSGNVTIVGARRPRRLSQFTEGRGVAARDVNQMATDIVAENREGWDRALRSLMGQPGETIGLLPPASTRASQVLAFDIHGNPTVVSVPSSIPSGLVTGPVSSTIGDLATWNNTLGTALADTPILGVPHGGTGQSSLTAHGVALGEGTSGVATANTGTAGQVLIDQGSGADPAFKPISGAITISSGGVASLVSGTTDCTQFAGNGNGSTDNTSALNTALGALTGNGGCIAFPAGGKYRFNSAISYNLPSGIFSVTLFCPDGGTVLYWPNASGGITFNYNGTGSSVHVIGCTGTTAQVGSGSFITLNQSTSISNPAVTAGSEIYNVTCRGDDGFVVTDYWTNCINIVNVSNVQIDNLSYAGAASGAGGTAINLLGDPSSTSYAVGFNVSKSNINNATIGLNYNSYIQGVTVDQTNFVSSNTPSYGLNVAGSASGTLDELLVTNSQFNVATNAIGSSSSINHLLLANNLIFLRSGAAGINLNPAVGLIINGNYITCTSSSSTTGINIATGSQIGTVTNNTVTGCNIGLALQSGITNMSVAGNQFLSNTTPIGNGSTSTTNFILNNPGFNPVGSAAITVTASPFTYTASQSPETVYITGGTVSAVAVGAGLTTTACSASPCAISLGPNEQVKVTYSGLPTMNKMVH